MWTWFWIVAIVLVLLLVFKFKEIRHKIGLIAIALILIFLVFSFTQVYKSNKGDLKSFDGMAKVGKIYFSWLGNIFKNVGNIAGYAIHRDWGLNITNNTLKK